MGETFFQPIQDYNITFCKDGQKIGRMEWNDGVMKFTGNAEESAKVFFEYLKGLIDSYIAREKQNG